VAWFTGSARGGAFVIMAPAFSIWRGSTCGSIRCWCLSARS